MMLPTFAGQFFVCSITLEVATNTNVYIWFIFYLIRRTRLESEEIVAELVTSFLLPEVQKITMRENGECFLNIKLVSHRTIFSGDTTMHVTLIDFHLPRDVVR